MSVLDIVEFLDVSEGLEYTIKNVVNKINGVIIKLTSGIAIKLLIGETNGNFWKIYSKIGKVIKQVAVCVIIYSLLINLIFSKILLLFFVFFVFFVFFALLFNHDEPTIINATTHIKDNQKPIAKIAKLSNSNTKNNAVNNIWKMLNLRLINKEIATTNNIIKVR